MPVEWANWHWLPQQPGVAHSQPPVLGAVVLQLARPELHMYEHVDPSHDGVPVVLSQARPHMPQLAGVDNEILQPWVSGGVGLQSAHPCAQPE